MGKAKRFSIPRLKENKEKGNVFIKHVKDFKNRNEIKFRDILSKWVKDNPGQHPERWKWAFKPNILVLFVSPLGFHGWWEEWIDHHGDNVNWTEFLPKLEGHKLNWDDKTGLSVLLQDGDSTKWCTIQEFIAMENDDHVHTDFVRQNTPIVPMYKTLPQFLPTERPFFGSV